MSVLPGITITVDGRAVRSETLATLAAVPHVVVLTTTLSEHAVTVTSSYTGHPELRTHVTHLIVTAERSHVTQHELPHDEVPVTHARERCLLEHATALQDATGAHVDLDDSALQAASEM